MRTQTAFAFAGAIFAGIVATGSAMAAVTFTSTPFYTGSYSAPPLDVTFDGASASGYSYTYTDAGIYSGAGGLVSGVAAPPVGDTTNFLAVYGGGTATLTTPLLESMSVYIGSVDSYNTISFYNGGTLVGSFTGTQLLAPLPAAANGDQSSALTNRTFDFNFGNTPVNEVVFSSSGNSFEFDNVAGAAVPEPGVWFLLLTGFTVLGTALRLGKPSAAAA
jgi:hypothetical protein